MFLLQKALWWVFFYQVHWQCMVWTQESLISRWSMIVRANVVQKRTVVDTDWRFHNLCGSLRSKRFLASSSRKLGREQKKRKDARPNFRAVTRLETLATQATCAVVIFKVKVSQRWLPHRLSKRQSVSTTVLLRTTHKIIFHLLTYTLC